MPGKPEVNRKTAILSDITIRFHVIEYLYEICLTLTLYTILGYIAVFRSNRHPIKTRHIIVIQFQDWFLALQILISLTLIFKDAPINPEMSLFFRRGVITLLYFKIMCDKPFEEISNERSL